MGEGTGEGEGRLQIARRVHNFAQPSTCRLGGPDMTRKAKSELFSAFFKHHHLTTPDGVCNLVRYGNYYGTHSVTIPCNYYVSFDMGKIGCVTRSVTRMCSLRVQNVRFFCVTVSVAFTVTTTRMQHTAASRCVFVVGARRANT